MSEIDDVELLDKRGYLTICVSLVKDGKVYLRKTEGIREWFRAIRVRSGEIDTCHRFSLNDQSIDKSEVGERFGDWEKMPHLLSIANRADMGADTSG